MPLRTLHPSCGHRLGLLPIACAPPEKSRLFGYLRAPHKASDGSGYPDEAFAHARLAPAHDFFAITRKAQPQRRHLPQRPRKGQQPIGGDHSLYGVFGEMPHSGQAHPTLIAAAARHRQRLLRCHLRREFSSSLRQPRLRLRCPRSHHRATAAKDLVAWIKTPTHFDSTGQPAIVQFNHPNSTYRIQHIEYGMDDFGTDENGSQARRSSAP